jgi:hypothetical protein
VKEVWFSVRLKSGVGMVRVRPVLWAMLPLLPVTVRL